MVQEIALKFGPNRASNSLDVANLEFVWVVVVKTNFHAKPNLGYVKLSLGFDNICTKCQQHFLFYTAGFDTNEN